MPSGKPEAANEVYSETDLCILNGVLKWRVKLASNRKSDAFPALVGIYLID